MTKRPDLTTEAGVPVADNQHSETAGPAGPTLLQDHHLIEKLARFNRERIPERVVHAVGTDAYGHLEVTSADVPKWTRMKVFSRVGKRTEVFLRMSTVAGSKGAADTARDPRGFALKVYTEDGSRQGVRRPGGGGRHRRAQGGDAVTAAADGDRARPGAEAGLVAGADDDALAIVRRAVDLARQGGAEGLAGVLALACPPTSARRMEIAC